MAEFIDFEADASDLSDNENTEMEVDNPTLIDDADDYENNDPSFFRFSNQTRDIGEVLSAVAGEESLAAQNMEASNYNEYDHEQTEIDDFDKVEPRREKFLETLINSVLEQTRENSFYSALLFAIKFIKTQNPEHSEEEQLKEEIEKDLHANLELKKICVF